ncbi:MAG TPA: ABC transporter permease [Planctomycetaceae bacterium]|jgi:putative ABC transport system permease protein|nr:ABC transporter permease [Planctomycetaceae bacterium]
MQSIRLLVGANLRRRRGEILLVALSIAAGTMSLATAIPILLGVSRSIDVTFDKLHASQLLMVFDTRTCNAAATTKWWRNRPGTIAVTETMPTKPIWGGFWHNDRHIDQSLILFERPLDESENDRLVFVGGNETHVPERGTVWLTNTMAGGNHISVGDSIQIPVMQGIHEFKVAAIVVDANYSSGLISPTRAWVAPGELAMLFPMEQLNQAAIGIRFKHPEQIRFDWNDFVISRGGTYDGYTLDYEVFSTCYLVVFRLLGVILMLVAGVALVLVLGFIFATIQSAVLSDTRSIGVLQSIGMTIASIELMYVVQFALVALVAVPLGLLGSYLALKLVLSFMLQSLGTAGAEVELWTPLILTGIGVEIIIVSTAYFAARRCRQATPAEAIRYGVRVRAQRSWLAERIWNLPRLPLVAGLALRSVLARKRKAVVPLLAIAFAVTMATFSINTVQSINRIGENLALWGWDNADVDIVRGGRRQSVTHEDFLEWMGHDPRIAGIVPRTQLEAQIPARDNVPSRMIQGSAYSGDMELLGVVNVQGRNPRTDSEIALAVGTARETGKSVGDEFELNVEGHTLRFTVVGVYQSIQNLGQGYRVQASAVWRADPLFESTVYGVHLQHASQADEFIRDVERHFGEAARARRIKISELSLVTDNMSLALSVVSGLFLLMSLVFVVESAYMSVQEERSSFSILKTLGMTPLQMRLVSVSKLSLIACAALVLAIPLGTFLTPVVFNRLLPSFGVTVFPMEVAIAPMLMLVCVVMALVAAAAWFPAGMATRVSPRQFNLE